MLLLLKVSVTNIDTMDREQNSNAGYKVFVGILLVALAIALWGWWDASKDDSLSDVYEGVAAFQAEIDEACEDTTTEAGRKECADKLEEFEEALGDYRGVIQDVEDEATTTPSTQ